MAFPQSSPLSSWLDGEDVTTPAHDRHAPVDPAPPDAPRRGVSGGADALVFLAAVWLVVASVPLAYTPTGRFDLLWSDTVVGVAVGAVTMTRLVGPGATSSSSGITGVLGAWLVVAPFVLGYGDSAADRAARWNDVAIGVAVVVLTLAGLATTRTRSRADTVPVRSPGLVVGSVDPAE
jgi:hypothetical protein